jgi:hypothetical protein
MGYLIFVCMDCGAEQRIARPSESDPDMTVESLCDDCDPEYGLDADDPDDIDGDDDWLGH